MILESFACYTQSIFISRYFLVQIFMIKYVAIKNLNDQDHSMTSKFHYPLKYLCHSKKHLWWEIINLHDY